jgi:hypothetical protein
MKKNCEKYLVPLSSCVDAAAHLEAEVTGVRWGCLPYPVISLRLFLLDSGAMEPISSQMVPEKSIKNEKEL